MRAWQNEQGMLKTRRIILHNNKVVERLRAPTSFGFENGGDIVPGRDDLTIKLRKMRTEAENGWTLVKDRVQKQQIDDRVDRSVLLMAELIHGFTPFARTDLARQIVTPTDEQIKRFIVRHPELFPGNPDKIRLAQALKVYLTRRKISSLRAKTVSIEGISRSYDENFAGRKLIFRYSVEKALYSGTQAAFHAFGVVYVPITPSCYVEIRQGFGKSKVAQASQDQVERINAKMQSSNKTLLLILPP